MKKDLFIATVRVGQAGEIVKFEKRALTRREALEFFERKGTVISCKRTIRFESAISNSDRHILLMKLSSMLQSKIGVKDAVEAIALSFKGKIGKVAGLIGSQLATSEDLPSAMEAVGYPHFSDSMLALLRAGAQTGDTAKALKEAADFEYQIFNMSRSASKGLWSAIVSLVISGAVSITCSAYLGPKTMESDFFKMANKDGSIDLSWAYITADVMTWIIGLILLFMTFLFLLSSMGRLILPVYADKLILKIPFYKDIVLSKNNYITLYGLSLLVNSGVQMSQALLLAAQGSNKGALKAELITAAGASRQGKAWAEELRTLHPTDRISLQSAFDSSEIAQILDSLAAFYRVLYASRIATLVPTLQLIAAIFLAIGGGLIFAMVVLPLLMASSQLM